MDVTGRPQPLSDPQLDREVAAAVGIEPSAEFLARVRTRIAAEPESPAWRLSFGPLWGVAIVGIVLGVVISRWNREAIPMNAGDIAAASRDADLELRPHIQTPAPQMVDARPTRVERLTTPTEIPLRLSPVLFSAEERRALQRLVMAVEEGLVPPLPERTQVRDQTGEVPQLRIEPLVIEPLPQLARLEQIGAQ